MAAYELFAATTPDLMIQNIKGKAEAYGWTIDFFGTYLSHNRLHLHNADGAHFEIWYANTVVVNIAGCTGYSSGDIPTGQPGVSATCQFAGNLQHFICIGLHSIFIKNIVSAASQYQWVQFGYITSKIGAWTGGIFISGTWGSTSTGSGYSFALWGSTASQKSQCLINGLWSTLSSNAGGGVCGFSESELYGKMPFAYSGGIMPCPILLVYFNATTTTYRHPIGYAPDVSMFAGGNVYTQVEDIIINGETWRAINQEEFSVAFTAVPNMLLRIAL